MRQFHRAPRPIKETGKSRRDTRWAVILLITCFLHVIIHGDALSEQPAPRPPEPAFSEQLQGVLNQIVSRNLKKQPGLKSQNAHVALIDLSNPNEPLLAEYNGYEPFYPSSVIKMVYMGYVYQMAEEGALQITPEVYRKLYQMIHPSSNTATAWIVDLWSGTCGGQKRSTDDYSVFSQKRNACNRWLQSLGIEQINACQKTWGSPIPPGEKQFLRGGKPEGPWVNRNTMTAVAAARFLQILAADALVSPKSSEEMRKLMVRDVRKQSYQRMRIAGGVPKGAKVFSKTGTTSDTFHDAGIVRLPNGREFVLTVFITGKSKGTFIRNVSRDVCDYFMKQ